MPEPDRNALSLSRQKRLRVQSSKDSEYTHIGLLHNTARGNEPRWSKLRETPKYWATPSGLYFSKTHGAVRGGGDWPMHYLDLSSIKARD